MEEAAGGKFDPTTIKSLADGVLKKAKCTPDRIVYHQKKNGEWVHYTWEAYGIMVRQVASGLIKLGVERLENICILANTRLEWVVAKVGALAAGAVAAGIYQTCSAKEVAYIINHAEARVVFVESVAQYNKIKAERESLPLLKHIILFEGAVPEDESVIPWEDFLKSGTAEGEAEAERRISLTLPSELSTLIYTSGTTGPPKAVMLSHGNVLWTGHTLAKVIPFQPGDRLVSFLPLSHVAEQVITIYMPILADGEGYFSEGMEKLAENLKEVQPTLFFSPPRLWEKFNAALASKIPSGVSPAQLPEEAKKNMRLAIGLGHVRTAITGAAPISIDVLNFFHSIGITIMEVYGQSEDNGPATIGTPSKYKLGSCGAPLPGLEVKIAEDGEILVRAPSVFMGYLKDEKATKETVIDGWLYTGDLGRLDEEGLLYVTGRKKDIIITSGGKNITPINLESAVKSHPLVGDCVVVGDRRNYLTALVTLDPDVSAAVAKEKNVTVPELTASPHTREAIEKHIETINKDFAQVEQIKKFTILPEPFSLAKGEVTPTMKVKRAHVNKSYEAEIDKMYAD